ncbi:hypothetical protein Ddye_028089 [Dipteronia dyeriana]|uniref:Ribonuclease H1 N-terminal domain-containing protein n=1 Tax=Dipteronia dyeriana TaxID=168575 RepID=A0AAD9TR96_9ROSI|nr:hypothetical protein Ddye_028089 [Dipteronia dyeriana]
MAGSSKDSQRSSKSISQSISGKKLSIGSHMINFCQGVHFQPLVQLKDKITEVQQALLNNIWFFKNDIKGFLQTENVLSQCFSENNKFSFYVVFSGRKIGIFSTWQEIAGSVENFPNPIFKGYCSFKEAPKALSMFFQNQDGLSRF